MYIVTRIVYNTGDQVWIDSHNIVIMIHTHDDITWKLGDDKLTFAPNIAYGDVLVEAIRTN